MANARFNDWGKRSRSLRSRQALLAFPLLCLLVIGSLIAYHVLPLGQTSRAQASGLVQIPGHVPALVKKSTLLGPTDPNASVQLLIGLRPRNAQAMKAQADALTQLHSVGTRRYMTPSQIATAFAPAPSVQSALIAYMQGEGFSLSDTYKSRLIVGFRGTIGTAEKDLRHPGK